MPEVSVVSIAKNEKELDNLKEALRKQTFKNFEFVFSTKKGIPQAWNDAIKRARGKILLITESDALPLSNKWIEDMVKAVKENDSDTIVRGIEISSLPWCFCNLACYSKILKENKINEKYPVGEDTELFSRLHNKGYKGIELPIAPVLHKKKFKGFFKEIKNSYLYGKLNTQTSRRYSSLSFNQKTKEQKVLLREITTIFSRIAYLIGIIRGLL